MRWMGLLVVVLLLIAPALALEDGEANELRASYAAELIAMAGDNYALECGDSTVLNTDTFLPGVEGYMPVACAIDLDADKKAAMVSIDAGVNAESFITHFTLYANPDVDDPDAVLEDDLTTDACEDPTELGDHGWARCDDAIDKSGYKLYMKQGVLVNTYLFTYGFTPDFDRGIIGDLIAFFRDLFGLSGDAIPSEEMTSFTRGYFAAAKDGSNERAVEALFHGDATGEGDATIVLDGFAEDYSSLVDEPENHEWGNEKQLLQFFDITYARWQQLTSALRLKPTANPPIPGGVCGDEVLNFDEECEISGTGFLSRVFACTDILDDNNQPIYHAGELGCDPATCTLDTSSCIACVDLDDDDFPVAEGVQSGLKRLRGGITLGSLQLDTDYETPDVDGLLRQELGIGAQVVALPAGYFFGSGGPSDTGLTNAVAALVAAADCDENPSTCLTDSLASVDGQTQVSFLSGFVRTKMITTISEQDACVWDEGWDCPNTHPSFLGHFTDYETLLTGLATESTTPIMLLEPEQFDDGTLTTSEDKFRLALVCGALAQASRTLWVDTINGSLNSMIFRLNPESPESYFDAYQVCRAGVHAASNNLKLYYNPGALDAQNAMYGPLVADVTIDGLIVDDGEKLLTGGITFGDEDTPATELVSDLGASVIVLAAAADDPSLVAEQVMGAYRTNARKLLFYGLQEPVVGESLFLTATTLAGSMVQQVHALDDTILYRSDIVAGKARLLISHAGASTVLVNDPLLTRDIPFAFDSCTMTIETPDDDWLFEENTELTPDDFTSTVPADTPLSRLTIDDWSCFLGDTSIGSCSGSQIDCNDTEEPIGKINPGAEEVCEDNIDNDCDGYIDAEDAEGCISDVTPTVECNYDGTCDDGEDMLTCTDCVDYIGCPTVWEKVWQSPPNPRNGKSHYTAYMMWNDCGKPKMKIEADGSDNGNGYLCKLSLGADRRPSALIRTFEWKAEFNSPVIFWDSGSGQWGNVHAENRYHANAHSGWQFNYVGHGKYNNHLCWGVSSPSYNGIIGDRINLFDAEYCLAHVCNEDSDCDPSGTRSSHCKKVSNSAPTDLCIWDNTNTVGGKGGIDCPASANECDTNADCEEPTPQCTLLPTGRKICTFDFDCPVECEPHQFCKLNNCYPFNQIEP